MYSPIIAEPVATAPASNPIGELNSIPNIKTAPHLRQLVGDVIAPTVDVPRKFPVLYREFELIESGDVHRLVMTVRPRPRLFFDEVDLA